MHTPVTLTKHTTFIYTPYTTYNINLSLHTSYLFTLQTPFINARNQV